MGRNQDGSLTTLASRRAVTTHKVRYSKVAKGDLAAAVLGVVLGTFVGYVAFAAVGSASVAMVDLTSLVWHGVLVAAAYRYNPLKRQLHELVAKLRRKLALAVAVRRDRPATTQDFVSHSPLLLKNGRRFDKWSEHAEL
jgi:hypothetical protein